MINIDRDGGFLVISRCEYLYRDGLGSKDVVAEREMGDGDIVIPLPSHMCSREWDVDPKLNRRKFSDVQSAEIIIAEIRKRLGFGDCHEPMA